MDLHPATIRALITSGILADDPDDEWTKILTTMITSGHRDGIIAYTYAMEEHAPDLRCDPDTFAEEFKRLYREEWETAAEFAKHVAEGETEMGDEGEQQGRAWFLKHYGRYINWQQFAESATISDTYSLIRLDPENSRTIHAFEMEA